MIMLNFANTSLKLYVLGIVFSDYPIEGAVINELNHTCSLGEWRCNSGGCIALERICNGQINCSDGSDETVELCSTDYFGFADAGSWSNLLSRAKRQSNSTSKCGSIEYTCMDGKCINMSQVCDGVMDCTNKADETIEMCNDLQCKPPHFQCSYGACIHSELECNWVEDCVDGSDEMLEQCNRTTNVKPTPPISRGGCVMPPYPPHGNYTTTEGLKPGDAVAFTTLKYTCEYGYRIQGTDSVFCFMGNWIMQAPTCERQCSPLKSTSVKFKCFKQYSTQEIPCDTPQDHLSYVKAACKDSYHLEPPPRDLVCIEGSWNYIPYCIPACGTLAPQGEQLIINGTNANAIDFPWHVGLYDKSVTPTVQICGGSIFSPNLVVTAAHCVYKDQAGLYPASSFAVAAGKLYRRWNPIREEKYVQKLDVTKIEIPEHYKGAINAFTADIAVLVLESSFELSSFVRPVCIRFDTTTQLAGKFGMVAGWGLTAEDGNASPILKTVKLPFVSYRDCYFNSPPSFRPLLTSDKLCAGYTTGTALCKGDSGGGLVFPGYQDLHYLYGIVSTSPRNKELTSCSAFSYTAFTDLLKHREWFQGIWSFYHR